MEEQLALIEGQLASFLAGAAQPQRLRRREQLARQREGKCAEVEALRARVAELTADNATNANPRRIILRLDGGFGGTEAVGWLYEQGYSVVAGVHSYMLAGSLCKEEGLSWIKLSKNGFIAETRRTKFGVCPYPMRLFACRQWWGDQHPERWSALVVTPDLAPQDWPVRRVGVFYNGRQVIEANIKESKGIFASHRLPTRHQRGIMLYEELVIFAQNFIRWFRRQCLGGCLLAAATIKEMVRIGANSRAQVILREGIILLIFAGDSPWQGITLSLKSQISYQLCFPFLDDISLVPAAP